MSRRARWLLVGVASGAVVVAIWAAAAWHDLTQARAEMVSARRALQRVAANPSALRTADRRAGATREVDAALSHINAARHRISSSVPLRFGGVIPGLSTQRSGALRFVNDSRDGAGAAKEFLAEVDRLSPGTSVSGGAIPLGKLGELEDALRNLGSRLGALASESSGLWGPLHDARAQFDSKAREASSRLLAAADGLDAARRFLGAAGARSYFVAIQNNAEIRDQGMVLSYAVTRVNEGRLSFIKNGPITQLPLSHPADVPIPSGTAAVFGSINPTTLWESVNASADFAWSATAMRAMYQQATGQDVDGVVAIDVPGLAAVLRVVGPVSVPGLRDPLTAANADKQLLHDLYQFPPHNRAGEDRQNAVTSAAMRAVTDRLSQGAFDAVAMGQELGAAAAGGHLRLWSRFPTEEKELERVGLAGGPAVTDAERTFHVAVESRAPTKLDYYIRPKVDESVTLTAEGDAVVTTTVTVDNTAPVGAAPTEQLGPGDTSTARPGDYIAWVLLWGPSASTQDAAVPESGLQLTQTVLFVPAGTSQKAAPVTTVIHGAVKGGRLDLRLVPQPRLRAVALSITLNAPGWHVRGSLSRHMIWDRTEHVSWGVVR